MTRGEVECTVRSIFEIALSRTIGPGEDVSQETESGWDSVKHVELLFMLEETFEFTFTGEEMSEMRSFNSIVERVLAVW